MAKKAYLDIQNSEHKKLKRFFYFARATLSAKWIVEKQTMPSIVFYDALQALINDTELQKSVSDLIEIKSKESEQSSLKVPAQLYDFFATLYESLDEHVEFSVKPQLVTDERFIEVFES